jgi:hypothetical protein
LATRPALVAAHADWSVDPRKRWVAIGRLGPKGWMLAAPAPVGPLAAFLPALTAAAQGAPVALGLDCPLGLPRAYAVSHATEPDFLRFLHGLAVRPDFFAVCSTLEEIGPGRPFYPARGIRGMTRAAHAAALGLGGASGLCRACDQATAERPAGAPLFWTLGANQSGKAAISAWRDMLIPALTIPGLAGPNPPRLWPFEGGFRALLAPGRVAIAETYPAEAMRHLGLRLSGSKRRQQDRIALGPLLVGAMVDLGAPPEAPLRDMALSGFGADPAGEDRLDCVLGLLCLIGVLEARRPDTAPDEFWIRHWEGWVLGQTALPITRDPAPAGDLSGALPSG